MNNHSTIIGTILLMTLVLTGCQGTGGYVPVADSGERGSGKSVRHTHVVSAGETLYSIAWKYGLDYRDLAKTNNISSPYTIYVKQRLKLTGQKTSSSRKVSSPRKTSKASKPSLASAPARTATKVELRWKWPINGKVVRRFALKGDINKGVDISGKDGQKVNSAAAGTVVYAGGGLRGYGKLVILKHSDNYLSAYGNNSEILVKEGDTVSRGKTIARLAASGGNDPLLHFEIRRDGKPEDPLKYLPRK
jgi:lipoprotein NlpD